jgi:beta-mannanase
LSRSIGKCAEERAISALDNHVWRARCHYRHRRSPIIPTNSDGTAVGTLALGATGAYNSHFITLAQNLIAAGESTAYLRLGWEFDGGSYAWSATTPPAEASFASYFQQIVTAMREVAGEKFRFVWNPDADAFTTSDYNVPLAYPGDAYVDDIGLDAYDQTWVTPQTPANAWNDTTLPELTAAPYGSRHYMASQSPSPSGVWLFARTAMGSVTIHYMSTTSPPGRIRMTM